MPDKHKIILNKSEDWDVWIAMVKNLVKNPKIWVFVDPKITPKFVIKSKLIALAFPIFDAQKNSNDLKLYKLFVFNINLS